MTIRGSLLFSLALLTGATGVLLALLGMSFLNYSHEVAYLERMNEFSRNAQELVLLTDEFLTFGYERSAIQWHSALTQCRATADPAEPRNQALLEALNSMSRIHRRLSQLAEVKSETGMAVSEGTRKRNLLLKQRLTGQLRQGMRVVLEQSYRLVRDTREGLKRIRYRDYISIFVYISVLFLLLLGNGLLQLLLISRPLKRLMATARLIVGKDYSKALAVIGKRRGPHARDEISQLMSMLETMLIQVTTYAEDVQRNEVIRAQSVVELLRSQQRFQELFDAAPVALLVEDFSAVKVRLDALSEQGVTNVPRYLAAHAEEVAACAKAVQLVGVNQAALELFEAPDEAALTGSLDSIFTAESYQAFQDGLFSLADGCKRFNCEAPNRTLSGKEMSCLIRWLLLDSPDENWDRVVVSCVDTTERKQAEDELRQHRLHLEELVQERTVELRKVINLMAGREQRMVELKRSIKHLKKQLSDAGLKPQADDSLLEEDE